MSANAPRVIRECVTDLRRHAHMQIKTRCEILAIMQVRYALILFTLLLYSFAVLVTKRF